MKTRTAVGKFNSKPIFQIWEDGDSEDEGDTPRFACGMGKAELILKHLPDLQKFVKKNTG